MGELIPIFGMITGVLITGGIIFGVVRIMHSPVGIALGRRIQGTSGEAEEDFRAELGFLREQVDELQRQLGEAQERLDFAERMLSRPRPATPLSGE